MEYQIAWEQFTNEEQTALKKAINLGLRNYLVQCVVEMTPQKEVELQRLANQMQPVAIEAESGVLKKFTIEKLHKIRTGDATSTSPETPEEEAELQKLLDEEQLEKQKQFSEKTEEQAKNLEASVKKEVEKIEVKEEPKETDPTKTKWKVIK